RAAPHPAPAQGGRGEGPMSGALSAAGDWLAIGLLHGTALAALTGLAALTPLGRARPALWSALWTIVLLKFLVPVGPASELSLSSAIGHLVARPAGAGAALDAAAAAAPATHHAAAPAGPGLLALALAALYLAGLAWFLVRRIAARRRFGRHLAALPPAGGRQAAAVAAAARQAGLSRPVRTRIDLGAAGPYLAGRLRPVLVLPAWLAPDDPAFAAAVAHELAHLRRRDPLLALVQETAALLFWFWPPVAWVCRRLDRAREMACDEWALADGAIGRRAYARFLVEVASRRGAGAAAPAPGAIALVRRSQLAARVDHLLEGPRPARLGRRWAAAVAAWAALCLAGASSAAPAGEEGLACSLDPDVIAQILSSHPSADSDGDGVLSAEEACAHQLRMKRRLLDHVVD